MSIESLIIDENLRSADPAIDQRNASTPDRHVWVRASAGSGKTKVLVDRLLRLLLPDPVTGAPGIPADKILCLTFTKAGAAEMALRLQKRLLEWSVMENADLEPVLKDLVGGTVSDDFIRDAKRLLAKILDAPSRLRILTIHSFCQSVLGRFPIETGLSPDFKVVEESEASEYLQKALIDNLSYATSHPESDMGQVFSRLAISKNLDQLQGDLQQIIREPIKLQSFLGNASTLQNIRNKLALAFHITNLDQLSDEGFCAEENIPRASLRMIADGLANSSDTDKKRSEIILTWLSASLNERLKTLSDYKAAFPKKPSGKAAYSDPDLMDRWVREQERIDAVNLGYNIRATADLLFLGRHILKDYDRHKQFMGVMDYNDLIFNTRRLLKGDFWKDDQDIDAKKLSTAWVLYKLDEGIDHILVDESQDTNPDQWDIVSRLTEEYFSGSARPTARPRTLFVVGDEKQSIFSFQRADPEEFYAMRDYFAERVAALQTGFEESLIFSFRSTLPVLKLTDATFDDPQLLHHIGIKDGRTLRHISFRHDRKSERHGSVELWAPIIEEKKEQNTGEGWTLPFGKQSTKKSASELLAIRIASYIQGLIVKGQATPGDIMILMRTRSPLMLQIIRELKNRILPVSGLDRMVLSQSLIVQDLLSVCDFALLPENNFALACLLKSPFIGLDDDDLMKLCLTRPREKNLWQALKEHPDYQTVTEWLAPLILFSRQVQPYEFLDHLLTKPCPADPEGSGYRACQKRLGLDVLEPLDEILGQALKLELQDIRTLQDFVAYQRNNTRDIKLEMEESANQVRIMTVHASKGLEAPIVILPDTMTVPDKGKGDNFLWQDKSKLEAPLWSDNSKARSNIYKAALDHIHDLQLEEHSRLLYVAMTRARERLIICGASRSEKIKENSWYARVESGFSRLTDVTETDSGDKIYAITKDWPVREMTSAPAAPSLPDWIHRAPAAEKDPLISFTPSAQGVEDEPAVYSPLAQSKAHRFRRGLATHKLLQILPDLPSDRQENAARQFISREGLGFSRELQNDIVTETMKVLRDPIFAPVFGPGSLAEVPVTGELPGGKLINGQIDRLVITQDEILIVDFKTNRPSPDNAMAIPASYRAQLKAYSDVLKLIYPGRIVKCALLWTDKPLLMPVF